MPTFHRMSPYWALELGPGPVQLHPPLTPIPVVDGWVAGTIREVAGIPLDGCLVVLHNGAGLWPHDVIPDVKRRATAAHDLAGSLPWASFSVARAVQRQFAEDLARGGSFGSSALSKLAPFATWPWAIAATYKRYRAGERQRFLSAILAEIRKQDMQPTLVSLRRAITSIAWGV